ncbi:MAG: methylmalonyl Co-A mutase-associated GTPase MeaB [Candidatus Dojkabacteria bacterium]
MLKKQKQLLESILGGDYKSLARALTIVENELTDSEAILKSLKIKDTPVIGITGPPGAGKSTLLNAIIEQLSKKNKIAVLAIDPTSPFNMGSLLGDRIRMSNQFNNPNVFIRSLATRGSLGGLSVKTIELVDVLKAADFDYIFVETVGVGQSEIEIVGLADLTIVVLVPESGDEIQSIKSGLMEIADIFVINKADREGADTFSNHLKKLMNQQHEKIPVLKTIAQKSVGVEALILKITKVAVNQNEKKTYLLTEKAWHLIQNDRMKGVKKEKLRQEITEALKTDFNLYSFIEKFKRS